MFNSKRMLVAVAFSLVMGLVCYMGGRVIFDIAFTTPEIINIFVNRMLIGFVIGVSVLRMDWYVHGMLMGFIVGLPYLMYDYITGKGPLVVISVAVLNPLYGLAIEYLTSKLCKLES